MYDKWYPAFLRDSAFCTISKEHWITAIEEVVFGNSRLAKRCKYNPYAFQSTSQNKSPKLFNSVSHCNSADFQGPENSMSSESEHYRSYSLRKSFRKRCNRNCLKIQKFKISFWKFRKNFQKQESGDLQIPALLAIWMDIRWLQCLKWWTCSLENFLTFHCSR